MQAVRLIFLAIVGAVLIVFALANREMVTFRLLPPELAEFLPWTIAIKAPAFIAIFGGMLIGVLIGFVWEWMREHRYRAAAERRRRNISRLEEEVDGLKKEKSAGKDEILAMLD